MDRFKPTMPSICIPRVYIGTTKQEIIIAFEKILGNGSVHRVDLIRKQHGMDQYQRAFVHFSNKCIANTYYNFMIQRLRQGLDIKVVYSEHLFWKCTVSRVPIPLR
jgi:hypothetical protein